MGVEFEMYALPSFSSCWDEDVLKCLLYTANPTVVKMRIDSKKKPIVGGSHLRLFSKRYQPLLHLG